MDYNSSFLLRRKGSRVFAMFMRYASLACLLACFAYTVTIRMNEFERNK